ncbi:MAG: preprotein translocase subunit YajC [Bdellovibrionota bacterium]
MRLLGALFILVLGFATSAFAQGAPGAAGAPSPLMQIVPFLVIFGVMYFLMIRPQMKKQKTHQEFLSKLERGTEVITNGGILGRIEGMTDLYLTLEIAPGVRIKVLRSAVLSSAKAAVATTEAKA